MCVSEFVRWLRAPADNVIVFDVSASRRSESTVNRHLAPVFGFYDSHARAGVGLAVSLVAGAAWLLQAVPASCDGGSVGPDQAGRAQGTTAAARSSHDRGGTTTILAACTRLRDRFLFALLALRDRDPDRPGARAAPRRLRLAASRGDDRPAR
jgi:integrase/recombinase XerD